MKVSVIVLNYNGKKFLQECLDSLLQQTYKNFEIILIDNGSSDGSVDFIKQHYEKKVRFIQNPLNTGFTGGNNLGVKLARGELMVLLNNDTYVFPDWLQGLVDAFAGKGEFALVTSVTVPEDLYEKKKKRTPKDYMGSYTNPVWLAVQRPLTDKERTKQEYVVFDAGGASLAFRKKNFPVPFDDSYFAYAEDTYISLLARLRGGVIYATMRSQYFHKDSGGGTKKSSKTLNKIATFNGTKNEMMNYLIFYEWKNVFRFIPYMASLQLIHILTEPRKLLHKLKAVIWILMNLAQILKKRNRIQRLRKVRDKDLIKLMTYKLFDDTHEYLVDWQRPLVRIANRAFYLYCWIMRIRTHEFFRA